MQERRKLNRVRLYGSPGLPKLDPVKAREVAERQAMQKAGIPVDFQENFLSRSIARDREFALCLLKGWTVRQAAEDVGMSLQAAEILLSVPAFAALIKRLRQEEEDLVYGEDPDQMTESLARGNVWALRQVRDNPTGRDSDKLKAALVLHEMRPSVQARKTKQAETGVRVSFSSEIMERMQDGLRKIKLPRAIEVRGRPVPDSPAVNGAQGLEDKEEV